MIKMGLRSAKDVASLSSPSILVENIPFLSQWVAEEMVSDARVSSKIRIPSVKPVV